MIEKVSVPEDAKGQWRIERFSINDDEARAQSMKAKFRDGRGVITCNSSDWQEVAC